MELTEDELKEIERCVEVIRQAWRPYTERELNKAKYIYREKIEEKKARKKNAK